MNKQVAIDTIMATIDTILNESEDTARDKWVNWAKGNIDMAISLGLLTDREGQKYYDLANEYRNKF